MSAIIYSFDRQRVYQGPGLDCAPERQRRSLCALSRALRASGYSFPPISGATQQRINARAENADGADLEAIFGWNRPFRPAVLDGDLLDLMYDAGVVEPCRSLLRSSVRAVTVHGNLYLHSGFNDRGEVRVNFGPSEFRFVRALRQALPRFTRKIRRAASLCCGAGAGALTLAKFHPGAEIFASDDSASALVFAEINARAVHASNFNLLDTSQMDKFKSEFDLIVAHPPWLCDGRAGATTLLDDALHRLAPGGTLLMHAATAVDDSVDRFQNAIEPVLKRQGCSWNYEVTDPDIASEMLDAPPDKGFDRIAAIWLCATRQD